MSDVTRIIIHIIFVLALVLILAFFLFRDSIDQYIANGVCKDEGGSYNYERDVCEFR